MLKLLDEKGISVDAKIINYLPTYWAKGANIGQISFRNLLQHRSGFATGGSASDFSTMKARVAAGVPGTGNYDYENMNFGLCRILTAVINGNVDKNANYGILNDQIWDMLTVNAYRNYVQAKVLTPAGVGGAGFAPAAGGALAYRFPHLNQGGWNSGDLSTMSGGAGWRLSVKEVLNVMDHARRKGTILPANRTQFLLDNRLGIDQIIDTPGNSIKKRGRRDGAWNTPHGTVRASAEARTGCLRQLPHQRRLHLPAEPGYGNLSGKLPVNRKKKDEQKTSASGS